MLADWSYHDTTQGWTLKCKMFRVRVEHWEGKLMRKEVVLYSGGMASDTSVSFARWQQSEQTVTWVGVVFKYPLGSVLTCNFTDITDAQYCNYMNEQTFKYNHQEWNQVSLMHKQPFSHKVGAAVPLWQLKYSLLWVVLTKRSKGLD